MNLFDSILASTKNSQQSQITHILSYDLRNATPKTYSDLAEVLQKKFAGVKTHLQSQTVWELCTIASCEVIIQTIISVAGVNCQVNVYKVLVTDKETYPVGIVPKKLLQK